VIDNQLIEIAIEERFSDASIVDTSSITFDPSFRAYCEENLCGQYGNNYSCPPHCGTPDEMKQTILKHKKALVLQTVWSIKDCHDEALIESAKQSHRAYTLAVIEKLERHGFHGFMIGASFCSLCAPCVIHEGKPCKFPQQKYSCMSAYCIHVKDLAIQCGMTYDYIDSVLPLFSMFVFD
jgi:predicted metal-binding protein